MGTARARIVAAVRRPSRLFAAALVPCVLGCQPGDAPVGQSGTQVRDSADIRIIENPRPPEDSRLGWRVGPEPAVTIGAAEGEEPYLFQHVIGATRLGDGRIVVANYGSMELRIFDGVSGTHLATRGGVGEGPGEFGDLMDVLRLPGDSIMAWGFPLRASIFDPAGNFVRGFRMERQAETTVGLRPIMPVAAMEGGSILASVSPAHIDTLVVELWDAEGMLRAPLGSHLAHEPRTWVGGLNRTQTFGWDLKLSPWGDLVIVTPSKRYEIRAFAADGTLTRIVRVEHVPRGPTEADVEAYAEERVNSVSEEAVGMMGENLEDVLADTRREALATPVAEQFPAFASVMSDRAGHLWVEEYEVIGEEMDGALWTVFDPDGHVLGFVETPDGMEIFEIGDDYILARVVDELGVESVQLWPLERAGG